MDLVICGIDPGLHATGYAVLQVGSSECRVIDAGVCRFDRSRRIEHRLADIEHDLTAVFREYTPSVAAIEQLYAHYKHPRTAVLMGHARGVMMLAAARCGMTVRSYGATRIKRYVTGNGRASKLQVQRGVQHMLKLPLLPEPSDVADALAVALCCAAEVCRAAPAESRA